MLARWMCPNPPADGRDFLPPAAEPRREVFHSTAEPVSLLYHLGRAALPLCPELRGRGAGPAGGAKGRYGDRRRSGRPAGLRAAGRPGAADDAADRRDPADRAIERRPDHVAERDHQPLGLGQRLHAAGQSGDRDPHHRPADHRRVDQHGRDQCRAEVQRHPGQAGGRHGALYPELAPARRQRQRRGQGSALQVHRVPRPLRRGRLGFDRADARRQNGQGQPAQHAFLDEEMVRRPDRCRSRPGAPGHRQRRSIHQEAAFRALHRPPRLQADRQGGREPAEIPATRWLRLGRQFAARQSVAVRHRVSPRDEARVAGSGYQLGNAAARARSLREKVLPRGQGGAERDELLSGAGLCAQELRRGSGDLYRQ